MWDVMTEGLEQVTLSDHSGIIVVLTITADGLRALSGSEDGTIKQWNVASGKELHALQGHTESVKVVVTPDGLRALSGSEDATLKVWDLTSGPELYTSRHHTGPVNTVL